MRQQNSSGESRSEQLRPEFPPVQIGLLPQRISQLLDLLRLFRREARRLRNPVFPFDWNTLRDGCALREDTPEVRVMPMRRKVYPGLGITVAIDQSAQRREWQIKAIDGMREEHRVSFRGLDGPQIMEFDDEAVGVEKRRTGDLASIVERDWRPRFSPTGIQYPHRAFSSLQYHIAVSEMQVAGGITFSSYFC